MKILEIRGWKFSSRSPPKGKNVRRLHLKMRQDPGPLLESMKGCVRPGEVTNSWDGVWKKCFPRVPHPKEKNSTMVSSRNEAGPEAEQDGRVKSRKCERSVECR